MSGQPISGHKGRDRWLRAILARDVLRLLEVRVAVLLGIHFNCTDGRCDPGYDTLASELGISRRTLFRAIARLKADGWIEVHRVGRDEKVQFSLFIRPQLPPPDEVLPARGASMLAPQEVTESGVRGDTMLSPQEVPDEVTENGGRGDKNRGVEVTHRLAAQKNLKPENLKSAALRAARTADAVRESEATNSATSDDETPNQRASHEALIETSEAQQLPPERDDRNMGRPSGNGADGSGFGRIRMEFERLTREYPADRVGDKAAALLAFNAAVGERGVTRVGIEIETMLRERGGDVPDLIEALTTIARGWRPR